MAVKIVVDVCAVWGTTNTSKQKNEMKELRNQGKYE